MKTQSNYVDDHNNRLSMVTNADNIQVRVNQESIQLPIDLFEEMIYRTKENLGGEA